MVVVVVVVALLMFSCCCCGCVVVVVVVAHAMHSAALHPRDHRDGGGSGGRLIQP